MISKLVNAIAGPKPDRRMRKALSDWDPWEVHCRTIDGLVERSSALELKGHTGGSIADTFRSEGYYIEDIAEAMQRLGYFAITEDHYWHSHFEVGTRTRRLRVSEWPVLRGLDDDFPEYGHIFFVWTRHFFTWTTVVQFPGATKYEIPVRWKIWLLRNFMWWWNNDVYAFKMRVTKFVPARRVR